MMTNPIENTMIVAHLAIEDVCVLLTAIGVTKRIRLGVYQQKMDDAKSFEALHDVQLLDQIHSCHSVALLPVTF